MKIIFIRHSKVDFKWKTLYNTQAFNIACKGYDGASIVTTAKATDYQAETVYISTLSRSEATADVMLKAGKTLVKTPLVNEIPLSSFTNTTLKLPAMLWMIAGRLQWYFNSAKQPETRKESTERINQLLNVLQRNQQDCIIVGHGFYFAQLVGEMKKRGITGDMRKRIKNEEMRVFTV